MAAASATAVGATDRTTARTLAGTMVRTVVVVSAEAALRQRLRSSLAAMRWHVREAAGGAEALAQLDHQPAEALLLDHWLPDLEVGEFAAQIEAMFPAMDLLRMDGSALSAGARSPRRHELLHALREAAGPGALADAVTFDNASTAHPPLQLPLQLRTLEAHGPRLAAPRSTHTLPTGLDDLIGHSPAMLELARLVRLVAPRSATVLIEGETGTGKEVVAKAVHRLSARAHKPFVVLNCAAIPESLLEAELFGHTRGAFTGAVHARTGRIEAAHGGTLFLDEIGEMPYALQAKLLRFLECGEIQRVGENDTLRVDVRVVAATHQPLEQRAAEGTFRLDLYHRLAVFPIEVPPLRERLEDIPALAAHFLAALGKSAPRKSLSPEALTLLLAHPWPGNVRELAHVLERASILAAEAPVICGEDIRLRRRGHAVPAAQAFQELSNLSPRALHGGPLFPAGDHRLQPFFVGEGSETRADFGTPIAPIPCGGAEPVKRSDVKEIIERQLHQGAEP